jgi:Ribonuclease G/E
MRFILFAVITAILAGPQQQFPRDPFKEMQRRAEKEATEKNYKELKEAAAELADLSKQISLDIEDGGKNVISARIFERLERVEQLAKRIREKAKGSPAAIPKVN